MNDPGARGIDFATLGAAYREAAEALVDGGVDLILLETIFDSLNAKAALVALDEMFEATGTRLPILISGTVTDRAGRMLNGQTVEAFWLTLAHAEPFSVGLNCSFGAADMRPPHRRPGADRRDADQRLPQCRAPQRVRRL